jgi:hypothetical protein
VPPFALTIPDLTEVELEQFLWGLFGALVGVKFADGLAVETAPLTSLLRYRLAKTAVLEIASNFAPALRARFEEHADQMAWEIARSADRQPQERKPEP